MRTHVSPLLLAVLAACAGGRDGRGCGCPRESVETGQETAPPDTNETDLLPDDSGEETGDETAVKDPCEDIEIPEVGTWECDGWGADELEPQDNEGEYAFLPGIGEIRVKAPEWDAEEQLCVSEFEGINMSDGYSAEGVFYGPEDAEAQVVNANISPATSTELHCQLK